MLVSPFFLFFFLVLLGQYVFSAHALASSPVTVSSVNEIFDAQGPSSFSSSSSVKKTPGLSLSVLVA